MLKQTGAMGYFTDFISASSQVKCKPIVDKFFSELCSMELTQQEAQCITVSLNCMVSDEINESKKTTMFCRSKNTVKEGNQ